jgi:pyridoxine 4-dehydrogenase
VKSDTQIPRIWGAPPDRDRAKAPLRRAVDLGVTLIDTADALLLARSPWMPPIPGSGSPEHMAENVAVAGLELSPDEITAITKNA